MTDTRWEECKQDLYSADKSHPFNSHVDHIIDKLKEKGWTICYPADWPDLCQNCKSHIEEGTWHSVFNGNFWGSCEVHQGEGPKGWWGTPGETWDPIEYNRKFIEKYPSNGLVQ